MEPKERFLSLRAKIIIATLIPVVISFSIIIAVIFSALFNALHQTAKAEFLQISQKYVADFEKLISNATNYLDLATSTLELRVATGLTDRVMIKDSTFRAFTNYGLVDGSSIYFEPNMFDGLDAKYKGTQYGTEASGRICYYFYKGEEGTQYLPEAMEDEVEFTLPHYTGAKKANRPIYTGPAVYEVDGQVTTMLTITYPVRNPAGSFIGAVTVDLFLEDLYAQLQNEKIYDTGYIIISNDNGEVIYSPRFEDIGKTREEIGLNYTPPTVEEKTLFGYAKSMINGKNTFVTIDSVYIPKLDSCFYVSVSAPVEEIDASGTRLTLILIAMSAFIVLVIAGLLYYLISRILSPVKEITESANKIAGGDLDAASAFVASRKKVRINDEVYTLREAIKQMLSQLSEMQQLRLEAMEMKHKKEKAEAAAQAKNTFLAKMSHEIRTPMNAVMGMSELILRKELPQDVYENALGIKSASDSLLSIINDILDFSKIESGMLEIIETGYLFPSLINDVIGIIRVRLIKKPIQFAVNIDPEIPACLIGDEIRIRQVLLNLLSNAVKYTSEGFISLTVTGDVGNGDTITLTINISDSGVGVREEDIDKLFGDFVQIDSATNKGIEGTGLGLAISRNLCRTMGGDITVESRYGEGSTFTITLPQRFEPGRAFAEVDDPLSKPVLLYETRDTYRDSLIRTFEDLGVPYLNVGSIPELFENMEKYPFAFISSFMYGSVSPAMSSLVSAPRLVLLADIEESCVPKGVGILSLPAHSLSVANILNDVCEDGGGIRISGASFTAPEAKVLVVDDITANLKVAEGLMEQYEMQITICTSGREAVRLVSENRYDLVFMDHMMPEMDGLQATAMIREMEGEYFKTLPIVALTANAVSGVREMFVQNGMNDFLAKPIETAKLDAVLEKWIPEEKRGEIIPSDNLEEGESAFVQSLREVRELSVKRALSVVGGSAKTYERSVKLSARLLPDNIARLSGLLGTDLPNYAIEVHGMKSVLNNIGAYELGNIAARLEELSRNGDSAVCEEIHPGFIERLTAFSDLMERLMDTHEAEVKPQGDASALLEALPKLKDAAEYFDSALALEMLTPLSESGYGEEADKMMSDLAYAFERFDFEAAIELVEKLEGVLGADV